MGIVSNVTGVAPPAPPWSLGSGYRESVTAFFSAWTGLPDVRAVIMLERGGYFVLVVSNKVNSCETYFFCIYRKTKRLPVSVNLVLTCITLPKQMDSETKNTNPIHKNL